MYSMHARTSFLHIILHSFHQLHHVNITFYMYNSIGRMTAGDDILKKVGG